MIRQSMLAGLVIAAATSSLTWARNAPSTPGTAAAVSAVMDCRAIADSAQRLACFDKTVGEMAKAETSGELLTLDREQRRSVRRQAFGLNLPSLTIFDRGEKGEDADRLTAKVVSAHKLGDGKWLIQLEGGAVWRQTDDQELFKEPHDGSTAVIKRGTLGSFFMKIDGDTAFRAHRDS